MKYVPRIKPLLLLCLEDKRYHYCELYRTMISRYVNHEGHQRSLHCQIVTSSSYSCYHINAFQSAFLNYFIFSVSGRLPHEKVEKRTLSCQTDLDLIKILLQLHSHLLNDHKEPNNPAPFKEENPPETEVKILSATDTESGRSYDLPEWATLSASALLQTSNLRNRRFDRPKKQKNNRKNVLKQPQIVEESVTDDSDNEHSGKFKQITISLGDMDPDRISNHSQAGTNSTNSPVSWSSKSDSVM